MQFQASPTLKSRTYLGLIIAQFLAAFNDQAIHASAMFYAIRTNTLTEAEAITLMPILFYLPWAIFCTLAGYLADRFSKRYSLIFWKVAEVGITLVTLAGFWLGTEMNNDWGPWIVLSTVFLMGMHSAFFVPAKYGVMPEILQPTMLSKGNGILESTSFLAVILGTVSGGILSSDWLFKGREYWIGVILVGLAVAGVVASFLIRPMPAANPLRPFPFNLVKPLYQNLRLLLRARPLALAVLGIAFFTFMVAFMRATVYMHGESHHWTEFKTSVVVAFVGLGIGLGSPLAGYLSGQKVELGLVPLGAVGMILATAAAGWAVYWLPGLAFSIVCIGFFAGFYIVPLYTLLQHRAPKASKGDLIATSNFINVTGAIGASLLFFGLEFAARQLQIAQPIYKTPIAAGTLESLYFRNGRVAGFRVQTPDGRMFSRSVVRPVEVDELFGEPDEEQPVLEAQKKGLLERLGTGDAVEVSRYVIDGRTHFEVRPASQPLMPAYNQEAVPRYLFFGAGLMTLFIIILLCRQLPDFFVRALLWLRSHGRYRLKVVGIHNLPGEGPVILASNCDHFDSCMQVVTATDRFTRFILVEKEHDAPRPLLRYLARRTGLVALRPGESSTELWSKALVKGKRTLAEGHLLGLTMDGEGAAPEMEELLAKLRASTPAPIVPVFCDTLAPTPEHPGAAIRRVRVVIGQPLRPEATTVEIRQALRDLDEWTRQYDRTGGSLPSVTLPAGAGASPSAPAADHPSPE